MELPMLVKIPLIFPPSVPITTATTAAISARISA